nr:immunoglobulin light chain junction region [Macaca mulatta]
CQQDYTYPYSF